MWNCCLFRQTWVHDNHCYLGIKSDTGQHSQFLQCFWQHFMLGFSWMQQGNRKRVCFNQFVLMRNHFDFQWESIFFHPPTKPFSICHWTCVQCTAGTRACTCTAWWIVVKKHCSNVWLVHILCMDHFSMILDQNLKKSLYF